MSPIGSWMRFRATVVFALHKNYFNNWNISEVEWRPYLIFWDSVNFPIIWYGVADYWHTDTNLGSCHYGNRDNGKPVRITQPAKMKSVLREIQLTIEYMHCNCSWGHFCEGARVVTGVLLIGICDIQTAHRSSRLNVRLYAAKEGKNRFNMQQRVLGLLGLG